MSVYLADACALIEFELPVALTMTPAGGQAMADGEVHVLATTVWEVTRKTRLGKLASPVPPEFTGSYPSWLAGQGYRLLGMDWEDAAVAANLPEHHRDPMDRFLIAAALRRDWVNWGSRPSNAATNSPCNSKSSSVRAARRRTLANTAISSAEGAVSGVCALMPSAPINCPAPPDPR